MITSTAINGVNYLAWSKSIKLVLKAKKMLKFMVKEPRQKMSTDYED